MYLKCTKKVFLMSIYATTKQRYLNVTWGKTHTFKKIYLMVSGL